VTLKFVKGLAALIMENALVLQIGINPFAALTTFGRKIN
jgi:hypothetical protein